MKTISAILLTAIGTVFCANCADVEDTNIIRVLSYNIQHGAGVDGRLDLARIAVIIKSASPDIVSLQEVDNQTKRSNGVDQARELARLTGMKYAYGASMRFQGGKYGNAVLTTFPIKKSKVLPLPGEPRSALYLTLTLPDNKYSQRELRFIATHLDTKETPRLGSVPLIEKEFESEPDVPALLAGDLNTLPVSPTMQEFAKTWINSTSQNDFFTYPAGMPTRQIDYVMHRPIKSWNVIKTMVLNETVASDHRPILAVLKLLPDAGDKKEQTPNKPISGDGL